MRCRETFLSRSLTAGQSMRFASYTPEESVKVMAFARPDASVLKAMRC